MKKLELEQMELLQGGLSRDAHCGITAAIGVLAVAAGVVSGGALLSVAVGWFGASYATLRACDLL